MSRLDLLSCGPELTMRRQILLLLVEKMPEYKPLSHGQLPR